MKKKGFTLIELLAVIVILAIIALIATPLVLKYIEKSRKESKVDSAYSFVRNLETEIANFAIKNNGKKYTTDKESIKELGLDITIKGENPEDGKVCISSVGQVEKGVFKYGKYYVSYDGKKGSISDKDTYDNFSCSGNVVGDSDVFTPKLILEEKINFSYDKDDIYSKSEITIAEELINEFEPYYEYEITIGDNSAIKTYSANFYDSLNIVSNDANTPLDLSINGNNIIIVYNDIQLEGEYNVKIVKNKYVDSMTYFGMEYDADYDYGALFLYSNKFIAGNANVVIKDNSDIEYYNGNIEMADFDGDGIIGIDSNCRENIEYLHEVFKAIEENKKITIIISQNIEENMVETVISTDEFIRTVSIHGSVFYDYGYMVLAYARGC